MGGLLGILGICIFVCANACRGIWLISMITIMTNITFWIPVRCHGETEFESVPLSASFNHYYYDVRHRYNQNSRDGGKLTNDGQQSVPLCSTSDVQLRFLCPDDLDEVIYWWAWGLSSVTINWYPNFVCLQVRTLCQDWFPIDYPLMWYRDITSSTRFYALAAVYNLTIIGLIVAEIKPYCRLNKEVRPSTTISENLCIANWFP